MNPAQFPGPKSAAMIEELRHYVIADPYPFVVDIEKSEGMWIATIDGERLFDWAGYYASKWIAHNHPRLFEAAYLRKLGYAANNKLANVDFLSPECLAYYRALREVAPRCMINPHLEIYAINSGAEAVENMMKYLINLFDQKRPAQVANRGLPKERCFIYFDQAFHGRTVFALNITELSHDPMITRDYHGLIRGNVQVPFPALNADEDAATNRKRTEEALARVEHSLREHLDAVVGIIVEPIQGAGGHRVAEREFFQGLSRLAQAYDVPLAFDEVQTAGGQTGDFFMVDQLDLPYPPQAVAAAKKMGNGVLYMRQSMADEGVLDSTWGGSLADMVRFCQELRIVREERLIEQVPEKAAHLVRRLKELQAAFPGKMGNVRGWGLYQGFSLATPTMKAELIERALQEHRLLLLGASRMSVRLRPNLNVTLEEIDLLAEQLGKVLSVI